MRTLVEKSSTKSYNVLIEINGGGEMKKLKFLIIDSNEKVLVDSTYQYIDHAKMIQSVKKAISAMVEKIEGIHLFDETSEMIDSLIAGECDNLSFCYSSTTYKLTA